MDWFGFVFLVIELLVCLFVAILVFNKYGSWKAQEWFVPVLVIFGWVLCFYVVFSLPIDVSMSTDNSGCNQPCEVSGDTDTTKCELQDGVVSPVVMQHLWSVVYWSIFFLTWVVYPVAQVYSDTGEFNATSRLKTAIKSNLLLYAIGFVILILFLVVYLVQNSFKAAAIKELPTIAKTAGNLYGLLLLIALLGHGLVSVPQRLWRHANQEVSLKRYQFELASLSVKLEDSKVNLEKTLKKVRKVCDITGPDDPYRPLVDIIVSKCPPEFDDVSGEGNVEVTYGKLARLHQKVMSHDHLVNMYQTLYDSSVESALRLEDILDSKGSPGWRIFWSFSPARSYTGAHVVDVLEYLYLCYIEGWLSRGASLFCTVLSVLVVWCEFVTPLFCKPDLSVFSQLVRIDGLHWSVIQLFVFIPVMYIAVCAYTSLFRLRLFDYYHLVPHKMSNAASLLFSAAYLCRLIAPLAYNYLNMIRYTSTPFLGVMGSVEFVALFGNIIPKFYPVLLVPFSLATLFNLYGWILKQLRIEQFEFTETFTSEWIDEGEKILCYERRIRSQLTDGEELKSRSRLPKHEILHEMSQAEAADITREEEWDSVNPEKLSFTSRVVSSFSSLFNRGERQSTPPEVVESGSHHPHFEREIPMEDFGTAFNERPRQTHKVEPEEDPFGDFY